MENCVFARLARLRWFAGCLFLLVGFGCGALAYAEDPLPPQVASVEAEIRNDPRTLYADSESDSTSPHLSSSEFDWIYNTSVHANSADLVIGFGTNSAYDLALAQNARGLILVDHAIEPLLVQAYILSPFFILAETRIEFLGLLRGRDFSATRLDHANVDALPADKLFN